jgi:hypothetical protein
MRYKRQRSPQPPLIRGAVKVPLIKGDLGGSKCTAQQRKLLYLKLKLKNLQSFLP